MLQEVARGIGTDRMTAYLDRFNYGEIKVDSATIDNFWLQGDSKINQFQQIDFLQRFYQSQLPISGRTEEIVKRMIVFQEKDDYRISGKTGWSISNKNNNEWFVGYIETESRVYFFATNVEPGEGFDMRAFPMIRKDVTYKALKEMKIIN